MNTRNNRSGKGQGSFERGRGNGAGNNGKGSGVGMGNGSRGAGSGMGNRSGNNGKGSGVGMGNGSRGAGSGMGMGRSEDFAPGGGFRNDMPGFYKRGVGAQTFRRSKILNFLERLYVRKNTLQKQLEQEEHSSIQQVISGELKGLDTVINELIQEFDLYELLDEVNSDQVNKDKENRES